MLINSTSSQFCGTLNSKCCQMFKIQYGGVVTLDLLQFYFNIITKHHNWWTEFNRIKKINTIVLAAAFSFWHIQWVHLDFNTVRLIQLICRFKYFKKGKFVLI